MGVMNSLYEIYMYSTMGRSHLDGLIDVLYESIITYTHTSAPLAVIQRRRHGVDWGGHSHPTFARGPS